MLSDVPTDGATRKAEPVLLADVHLEELAPARDKAFLELRYFIGQRARTCRGLTTATGKTRLRERATAPIRTYIPRPI